MICTKFAPYKTSRLMRMDRTKVKEVSSYIVYTAIDFSNIPFLNLVRDKSRELCELLSDATMLQNEREFARQTREKLQGPSQGSNMGMGSGGHGVVPTSMGSSSMGGGGRPATSSAAGPASGRYGGFGSEDIARLGFNQENKFNAPYDPYTKGQSAPSM